jgi:hypothetical protein
VRIAALHFGKLSVKLRIADYGLQIADCGLRITDCKLRIADYKLQIHFVAAFGGADCGTSLHFGKLSATRQAQCNAASSV